MRALRRAGLAVVVLTALAVSFYFFYMLPRRTVPILMYHSISEDTESSLNVTPANFSRQMKFLSEAGYDVISLGELVEGISSGSRFPAGTVVITFDDGFEDNYLNAFPVLAKYDMPATVFLITGYVGKEEDYLDWDQVNIMKERNVDFGGHTRSNVYLPSVEDTRRLWEEVSLPREDIRVNTGGMCEHFCYPLGGFNEKVKRAVREAGYLSACTTNRGEDRSNRDVFELQRVKVTNSDMTKPFHFRAKLSGYYNLFRSVKPGD